MNQDLKVEIESGLTFQKGDYGELKVSTKNDEIKKEIEAMKIEN